MSVIVYWLADRTACGHYRCLLPGTELAKRGHEIVADDVMTMESIDRADVFIGQRVAKTGPSKLWQALAREKGRDRLMVYELDDDVFALPEERLNPNHVTWPPLLQNVRDNLACADVVTVSTDVLAGVVSAHTSAPVHVVPNAVPASLLDHAKPLAPATLGRIGWSGSATHDGDWEHALTTENILHWFTHSSYRTQWMLRTFGALPTPLRTELERTEVWHHHSDGVPDIGAYYKLLNRWFDIGLAPLAPTAFNYAKSDLRLLELAALGIPWIASNVGPYAAGGEVRGGLHGTRDKRSWFESLSAVVRDEDVRRSLRMQGRVWAATRTIDRVLPQWEAAFGLTE